MKRGSKSPKQRTFGGFERKKRENGRSKVKKAKSGFSKGKTEVMRGFKQEDAQTPTKQAKCPINKGILRFNGRKAEKLQKPAKAR